MEMPLKWQPNSNGTKNNYLAIATIKILRKSELKLVKISNINKSRKNKIIGLIINGLRKIKSFN